MKFKTALRIFTPILLLSLLGACGTAAAAPTNNQITASGTISAEEVSISAEVGGKVEQVLVVEGQQIAEGDPLFKIDDEYLLAQQDQAQAAVDLAQASVEAAQKQLSAAQIQYQIALQGSRLQEYQARQNAWQASQSNEIDTPVWYFSKEEKITALQSEIDQAQADYQVRQANLEDVLANATNQDFTSVETRLAEAQAAFSIAAQTLQQASTAGSDLKDAAQRSYDAALSELNAAQSDYDRLLTTASANDVLEARAQAAVAKAHLQNAQDALAMMLNGDDSLQVQAASAAVDSANAAVSQAQANLEQAQAALDLVKLQIEKTTVKSPLSGVVLTVNTEPGELVGAGVDVMTIAQLNKVTLTVYVSEEEYGRIKLGDQALVSVDSYPDQTYPATVSFISDEAQFTPRNVQTSEGRTSTVYAVKLSLDNPQFDLKPGMPADVAFSNN